MEKYDVTVDVEGTVCFYKPGTTVFHRLDGPAVECKDGYNVWYQDGKCHRTDGPAVDWADGRVEYWINGKQLTPAQFKEKTAPVKEMTIAEIEAALGHSVKVVK